MTKKRSLGYLSIALLVIIIGIFYYRTLEKPDNKEKLVLLEVRSIKVDSGWGYDIVKDAKVYIHQVYVPAIPGRHPFKTEADALKVGHEVLARLSTSTLPTISARDLKDLGIVNDSLEMK
jgi:hypothetical protein